MSRLISVELTRVCKRTSFYIIVGVALLTGILNVALSAAVNALAGAVMGIGAYIDLHSVLENVLVSDSNILMCLSLLLSITICSDFRERTVMHPLLAGFSRSQLAVSRWIIAIIMFLLIAVIYIGSILGLGLVLLPYSFFGATFMQLLPKIFLYLLAGIGMTSIIWLLIFMVRNLGVALGITLPLTMLFLPVLSTIASLSEEAQTVMSFIPFISQSVLLRQEVTFDCVWKIALVSGLSVASALLVGVSSFKKADL